MQIRIPQVAVAAAIALAPPPPLLAEEVELEEVIVKARPLARSVLA